MDNMNYQYDAEDIKYKAHWEGKNPQKCQFAINMFIYIFCAVLLTVALIGYFTDSLAYAFGKFVLDLGKNPDTNALQVGKIIFLSWIPICPLALFHFSGQYKSKRAEKLIKQAGQDCFQYKKITAEDYDVLSYKLRKSEQRTSGFLYVLSIILFILLIILFYVFTKPIFKSFEKLKEGPITQRFFENMKNIYIWYLVPFSSIIIAFIIPWLSYKLDNKPVGFMIISVILSLFVLVGIPVIAGFIGGVVAGGIMLGLLILAIFALAHMGDYRVDIRGSDGSHYTGYIS